MIPDDENIYIYIYINKSTYVFLPLRIYLLSK